MHQQSAPSDDGTNAGGSDQKSQQPRFGTQLVNYQPDLVEVSQEASANMPRDDDDDEQGPLSAFKQTTVEKDKPAFPVLGRPSKVTLSIDQHNSAFKNTRAEGLHDLNASDAAAALVDASLESSALDSQPIQAPED